MTEPLSAERLAQIRECANDFGRWSALDGRRVLALDLLAEVDRLRAENDAWRSYHLRAVNEAVAQGHALQVRIDAALSLHPRIDHTRITPEFSCEECGVHYPCPTVRALTGDQQ